MRRPMIITLVGIGIFALIVTIGMLIHAQSVVVVETNNQSLFDIVDNPTHIALSTSIVATVTTPTPSPFVSSVDYAITPTATNSPVAPVVAAHTPVYYDDFSSPQSGWTPLYLDQNGNANGYSAEGYLFDVSLPQQIIYDIHSEINIIPTRLMVDIRSVQGSGRFGVMFDVQGDPNDYRNLAYYAVTVNLDGEVALLQKVMGEMQPYVIQADSRSFDVPRPDRPITLAIDRLIDSLVVLVDGDVILRGTVFPERYGQIGLFVQAESQMRVNFDNLLLSSATVQSDLACADLRTLFLNTQNTDRLSGDDVQIVQTRLTHLGYHPGFVDGIFGPQTKAAVKEFQLQNELEIDGVVGSKTWCSLLSSQALRMDRISEYAENSARFRPINFSSTEFLPTPLLISVRGINKQWQLAIVLPGIRELRYLDTGGDAFDPAWHPGTQRLAFTSTRSDNELGSIWVFDTLNGDIYQASLPQLDSQFPAWSPDGNSLLYTAETSEGGSASARNYLYHLSTGRNMQWRTEHAGWSDWSSTGKVAFTHWTGKNFEIFVANADGSGAINLTNTDDFYEDIPAWSPDGRFIAFVRNSKSNTADRQICIMRSDGSDLRQLTYLPGPNSNPIWLNETTLVFANQPSQDVWQPYLLNISGEMLRLSANEDRIWFMGRFDFE
ncbi:peptidoglycan-binding protein [Candidatus Oscillochloris fontis]|uniref:peptidoglycan-binding protein n=1 Tax=Candidatus Oscillochloris fontis TaxID=2496868 RepID=UPI00101BED35|nr:peptidoglycan-binding protein [Candidatus Oscillochloris fontis]